MQHANISMPSAELERIDKRGRDSVKSNDSKEQKKRDWIDGGNAMVLLALASEPRDPSGCTVVQGPPLPRLVLPLVGDLIERGQATVRLMPSADLLKEVDVARSDPQCPDDIGGKGRMISYQAVGGGPVVLSINTCSK
ncbi:hypothetical protein CKY51_16500 [Xanthomonas maliensis]|nr:hypothetical protein CKY51_16500 [Xanthomonas maliensis]